MVLIEAMASSLPVISTKWRGIPQLVENSNAAILCEINSPQEYAHHIQLLLDDEACRTEMGAAAHTHYKNNFTRSKFTQSMYRVFSELLNR
jgi:glycosyltransferase involved in cell wall biosynthesis